MSRLTVLRVALVLVVAVLVGRLYMVQVADHESRRYSADVAVTTRRYITVPPRRGEIFAADGQTLLAESVPIYNLAVVPGRLPSRVAEPERRAAVLARLSQVASLTSTLTLSPTRVLAERPTLRAALSALHAPAPGTGPELSFTVAPADSLRALELSRTYGDVLTLSNPIEDLITRQDLRSYQGLVIKEDISPELALAIRENSNYLPGVEVIEAYRRRYPLSGTIPSLSHLLGYTGRINECELLAANPASSWLTALVEVLGYAGRCGLIVKPVDPPSIGFPPYALDDRIGKDGLEAAYESELRGRAGVESLLVDVLQRPSSAAETVRPVEHGHNLVLTIDVAYQAEVERILRRWIAEGERRRQNAREAYKRDYAPIF
ncbi:MAG: peptidoglycan glycosyltransferase, partial [Chloroflexaceae bacterium]